MLTWKAVWETLLSEKKKLQSVMQTMKNMCKKKGRIDAWKYGGCSQGKLEGYTLLGNENEWSRVCSFFSMYSCTDGKKTFYMYYFL